MRLALIDETDQITIQYNNDVVLELLKKYYEVHKDLGKAFTQLSQDLLEKARNERNR